MQGGRHAKRREQTADKHLCLTLDFFAAEWDVEWRCNVNDGPTTIQRPPPIVAKPTFSGLLAWTHGKFRYRTKHTREVFEIIVTIYIYIIYMVINLLY